MNKTINNHHKYTLGGEIKSTKWTSNVKFIINKIYLSDKSVVGSVVLSKFNIYHL